MISANLYQNLKFSNEKPVVSVLFKTAFSKEIRILLKSGQEMKAHKAPQSIIVELVDGEIDFGVEGSVYALTKGDILTLDADVVHDLKAKKDSIVRLSLSTLDHEKRVQNVVG